MTTLPLILSTLRDHSGTPATQGLPVSVLEGFLARADLQRALELAEQAWKSLDAQARELLRGPESETIAKLQRGYANFYKAEVVNPYLPFAACGPWIITAYGAVLYETGGYGMLGFGHNPPQLSGALGSEQTMANIMTASFAQERFMTALQAECAYGRQHNPFPSFACLNSGSEAMTLALRLSDMNAFALTASGGRYQGRVPWMVVMEGSFHGRTDRPARVSNSTRETYVRNLASQPRWEHVQTVPPNDVDALKAAFEDAEAAGAYVEAVLLEPVLGEGNPGLAITREFYDTARRLTVEAGCFLIVDAIQAGLRTYGCLSLMGAPGFTDAEAPDVESWSKALNGGQYPLSVIGLGPRAHEVFRPGLYGNTMTTNPRALDVGTSVLRSITPELRKNIQERGRELVEKLEGLRERFGAVLGPAQGTGMLLSVALDPSIPVVALGGLEQTCRRMGLNVIHGGVNSLRFTPVFTLTSAEVDLIVDVVGQALAEFVS